MIVRGSCKILAAPVDVASRVRGSTDNRTRPAFLVEPPAPPVGPARHELFTPGIARVNTDRCIPPTVAPAQPRPPPPSLQRSLTAQGGLTPTHDLRLCDSAPCAAPQVPTCQKRMWGCGTVATAPRIRSHNRHGETPKLSREVGDSPANPPLGRGGCAQPGFWRARAPWRPS